MTLNDELASSVQSVFQEQWTTKRNLILLLRGVLRQLYDFQNILHVLYGNNDDDDDDDK